MLEIADNLKKKQKKKQGQIEGNLVGRRTDLPQNIKAENLTDRL